MADKEFKELDFGTTLQKLQEEYMDIYEGITFRSSTFQ